MRFICALINETFFFQPSGSSKSTIPKRGLAQGLKLLDGAKLSIDEVSIKGKPEKPDGIYTKYVAQCGVFVRDMVPITVAEWNEPKKTNFGAKYLEQRIKDTLWESILSSFSLPADLPQRRKDKVKEWTLSKMAQQFNNWKKGLWKKY